MLYAAKYSSNDVIGTPRSPGIIAGKHTGDVYTVTELYPVCHSRITGVVAQFALETVLSR